MALKDYATSLVATAPSPATSGTSLVVTAGHGTRFPATPFDATVHPDGQLPTLDNAEKVTVTNISTDTFTITRAQGDTTAKSIAVGWRISASVFADSFLKSGDNVSELNNDSGFTTNTGTVTSVAVSGTDGIDVDSGSPVTGSGTIQLGVNASTLKTHLSLNNVDNTSDATKNSASATLTNKTISGADNTLTNLGASTRTQVVAMGVISGATLNSTGNKSITGVGFTPKIVHFVDGYNGGSQYGGVGAMTSTSQFAKAWGTRTISSSNVAGNSYFRTTRCCIGMTVSSGGASSLQLECSYVSMDADGFTINVNVATNARDVQWIAYA